MAALGISLLLLAVGCRERAGLDLDAAVPVAADAPLPEGLEQFAELRLGSGEAVVRGPVERVRFTAADEGLLGVGWGDLEVDPQRRRGFAWVTGTAAEVAVRVLPAARVGLSFTCRPLGFAGAPPQEVTVELADQVLGKLRLDPDLTTYHLPVPERLLGRARWLRFRFAWAQRPVDRIPGSSDARRLAAAFYAVDLVAAGAAATPNPAAEGDGFVQAGGTEVSFPILVPPGGMLEVGVAPEGAVREADVTGEVWVRRESQGGQRLAALPVSRRGTERWRVDLASFAGERVELAFRPGEGAAGAAVAWRRPRLLGDASGADASGNLVLIVVDTLRADHLSCYGGETQTPVMDALAASGVRFERAYSHIPITLPSHCTMFTSQLPREHGVYNNGDRLAGRALTLAEVMHENYRVTAGFVSLGVLSATYGIAQGFDTYNDRFGDDWWKSAGEVNAEVFRWLDSNRPQRFFLWVHYSDPHEPYAPPGDDYPEVFLALNDRPAGSFHADGRTVVLDLELQPGVNRLTLRPAPAQRGKPLMFRYPALDPPGIEVELSGGWHKGTVNPRNPGLVARPPVWLTLRNSAPGPVTARLRFTCEAEQTAAEKRAAYAREVEYTDRQLGILLDRLRADGWLDHALVVLTSDHGEGLGDHVQMAHVDQLYEAQVRVPLLFSFPGTLPAGVVVPDVVSHLDLVPTIDRLLRLEDRGTRRGRDLSPAMMGGSLQPAPAVLLETFRPEAAVDRRGLLVGHEKYILSLPARREELYDLAHDPGEHANLVDQLPDRAGALARDLAVQISQAEAKGGSVRPGWRLSEEERKRLETLGYIHE